MVLFISVRRMGLVAQYCTHFLMEIYLVMGPIPTQMSFFLTLLCMERLMVVEVPDILGPSLESIQTVVIIRSCIDSVRTVQLRMAETL